MLGSWRMYVTLVVSLQAIVVMSDPESAEDSSADGSLDVNRVADQITNKLGSIGDEFYLPGGGLDFDKKTDLEMWYICASHVKIRGLRDFAPIVLQERSRWVDGTYYMVMEYKYKQLSLHYTLGVVKGVAGPDDKEVKTNGYVNIKGKNHSIRAHIFHRNKGCEVMLEIDSYALLPEAREPFLKRIDRLALLVRRHSKTISSLFYLTLIHALKEDIQCKFFWGSTKKADDFWYGKERRPKIENQKQFDLNCGAIGGALQPLDIAFNVAGIPSFTGMTSTLHQVANAVPSMPTIAGNAVGLSMDLSKKIIEKVQQAVMPDVQEDKIAEAIEKSLPEVPTAEDVQMAEKTLLSFKLPEEKLKKVQDKLKNYFKLLTGNNDENSETQQNGSSVRQEQRQSNALNSDANVGNGAPGITDPLSKTTEKPPETRNQEQPPEQKENEN